MLHLLTLLRVLLLQMLGLLLVALLHLLALGIAGALLLRTLVLLLLLLLQLLPLLFLPGFQLLLLLLVFLVATCIPRVRGRHVLSFGEFVRVNGLPFAALAGRTPHCHLPFVLVPPADDMVLPLLWPGPH